MMWLSIPIRPRFASCGLEGAARAFSLVEVAMALGIVSFVMMSLLGLMAVSLNAERRAYEDTTVAGIAQRLVGDLKTNSFSSLQGFNQDRYFSYAGEALSGTNRAYYICNIRAVAHSSADIPAAVKNASNGLRLRVAFLWPPGNPKTNEVFETTLARY